MMSNRLRGQRRRGLDAATVAEQCPGDIAQGTGKGHDSLIVDRSFGSFALVEALGRAVVHLGGGQGGRKEDAPQGAVVVPGAVQVSIEIAK